MSGVNISPSYIVSPRHSQPLESSLCNAHVSRKNLMRIGDGSTATITSPGKEGGIVAIYYLGTLVGALM